MMLEATPFLNFNGDCHEAIALYEEALAAEVCDRRPWDAAMFGGVLPESMKNGVMYARLLLGGKVPIELSDTPPSHPAHRGSNMSVNVHLDDPDELDRVFEALSAGGDTSMPPENTFWGARFCHFTDRFGIRWMLHCQLQS